MPRIAGQVDETKTAAILEAAAALFADKGPAVSMEAIARRAGVSRQTLYNRFPDRAAMARAIAEQRSDAITAPLRAGGDPGTVLTAVATALLEKICNGDLRTSMRGVALMSPTAPDVVQAIYEAGPGESLKRLSAWLSEQDGAGRLAVPDPDLAAEMFSGMVLGHGHLRGILGIAQPDPARIPARAREAAARFLRAFAAD